MQKQLAYIIGSLILLLPFTFWTITPNFYSTPKQLLIIIFTVIAIIAWLIHSFRRNTITITTSSLTYPLIIFIIGLTINLMTTTEATTEALIGRGSLYLASAFLALIITNHRSQKLTQYSLISLILGSTILAIYSISQLTFLHALPALPAFMQARTFSPATSPLLALSIFVIGVITSITWATNTKSHHQRTLLLFATATQTIAIVAYLSLMIDGKELVPTLLPLTASWSIMLDSIKTGRNLLLGTGLDNFVPFYTSVKPLVLNNGVFWNNLPSSASSELLQIITTGGLILFLPLLFLVSPFFSPKLKTENKQLKAGLLATILIFIFTPGSPILTILLFILLALSSQNLKTYSLPLHNNTHRFLTLSLTLSLVFVTLFYTGRVVLAETHLRNAQLSLIDNDGQAVYEHHLQAIELVPTMTSYHLSYSQVNLTLAASLSQSNELTEDQRNQVTQLLAQAVREARTATALRPSLASTWSNLGFIYRNLINVADGAADLAISNYATALTLDPANPTMRLELGGIFYQLANSVEDQAIANNYLIRAIEEFTTATRLKPDYANAWYNLAKSYESADQIELAYQAMQQTIASLNVDSPDLNSATAELSALESQLPTSSPSPNQELTTNSQELVTPSPLPSPLPGGPIDLPEPTEQVTLIPSPSPSQEPTTNN